MKEKQLHIFHTSYIVIYQYVTDVQDLTVAKADHSILSVLALLCSVRPTDCKVNVGHGHFMILVINHRIMPT